MNNSGNGRIRRTPLLALDVAGLTPRALAQMPRLASVADSGFRAQLGTVLPAVACSAQATLLTGVLPRDHGIVGNGWYFRDLGEVLLWRQHDRLVQAERVWDTARRAEPGYRVANLCWRYAMGAATALAVTPRPIRHADARTSPDCFTTPAALHDRLEAELGPFPLRSSWGPHVDLTASAWIAGATRHVLEADRPDLTLVSLPHLDHELQRFGPESSEAVRAARELDGVLGPVVDQARSRGTAIVVLSGYGITRASCPVDVNRALRRAGLLTVDVQAGTEHLDPRTSRAFAIADHQVAHIYVRDPVDLERTHEVLADLTGVDDVLDEDGKRAHGLDHPRSGELVLVAAPEAWFTYYYWLDDARAPDFARLVEPDRKPGHDPAELLVDPGGPLVRARAAAAAVRSKVGLRSTARVVPLDPSPVRGTYGRPPASPDDGPVLLCSDPAPARDRIDATEVRDLLLSVAGLPVPGRR